MDSAIQRLKSWSQVSNFLVISDIGRVYRSPDFHDLVLPPFRNNVGVVQGVVACPSRQQIKIEINKIVSNRVIFID